MIKVVSTLTMVGLVALLPTATADDRDEVERLIDRLESEKRETPNDIIRELRPKSKADRVSNCVKHLEAQRRQSKQTPPAVTGDERRYIRECLNETPLS